MSFRLFQSNSHMQVQTVWLYLPVWYIFITSRFTRNVEFSTTKPHAAMVTLINSLSKKTTSWHSDWNNIIRLLDIDTWMISWLVCWQLLIGYCNINHMGSDQYNRSVRVIEKHNIIILPPSLLEFSRWGSPNVQGDVQKWKCNLESVYLPLIRLMNQIIVGWCTILSFTCLPNFPFTPQRTKIL